MSERTQEALLDGIHNPLVCIVQLLLQFEQPIAVPDDVVPDVPF